MKIGWDQIKTYFSYNWWKALALSFMIIIVWSVVNNEIISPNENERIIVSMMYVSVDEEALMEDSLAYMKNYPNQNIKEIEINAVSPGIGMTFIDFLTTRALPGTDIIILPESVLQESTASDLFLELDTIIADSFFENKAEYYYESEKAYGIKLSGEFLSTRFSNYLKSASDETYYLFINIFSVNIGDWNEDSKEDEQAVLEYIRWLID
jgi:hypothetical protein